MKRTKWAKWGCTCRKYIYNTQDHSQFSSSYRIVLKGDIMTKDDITDRFGRKGVPK